MDDQKRERGGVYALPSVVVEFQGILFYVALIRYRTPLVM